MKQFMETKSRLLNDILKEITNHTIKHMQQILKQENYCIYRTY